MKKLIGLISVFGLALLLLNSCSKGKDPKDSDLFVGTYEGSIAYKSDTEDKSASNGKVTVTKINDSYTFAFSDGMPNITNITFIKENDEFSINTGSSGTSYIRINASKLVMLYVVDGKTWTANCSR